MTPVPRMVPTVLRGRPAAMATRKEKGCAMTDKKTEDYPFIRLYGRSMGSYRPYIDDQVEKARADKAPQNAVYQPHNEDRWKTTDEIYGDSARADLGLPPLVLTADNLAAVAAQFGNGTRVGTRDDGAEVLAFPSIWEAQRFATFAHSKAEGLDLDLPLRSLSDTVRLWVGLHVEEVTDVRHG